MASGKHASNASALTDSDICVVPYERLETVCHEAKTLQQYLYRALSQEIVRKQSMMFLLGSMASIERIAAFLLNVSERLSAGLFAHRILTFA